MKYVTPIKTKYSGKLMYMVIKQNLNADSRYHFDLPKQLLISIDFPLNMVNFLTSQYPDDSTTALSIKPVPFQGTDTDKLIIY